MPLIFVAAALSGMALAAAEPSGAPAYNPLDAFYPEAARAAGLEGRVVLSCVVAGDGVLSDCVVIEETPRGKGFGEASIKAARLFRMNYRTTEGQPIEGARIKIPIRWRLDHTAPPPGATVAH
jgi:TonB family protein